LIVPDINLLLYAYDSGASQHARARAWLEEVLSGTEPVGFAAPVLFGFVRIATSPRVFRAPMSISAAATVVRSWLAQPNARVLSPSGAHVEKVLAALERLGTAGNLVTDAEIATLALEHEAVLATADADFLRFSGLRWHNPLTGATGG